MLVGAKAKANLSFVVLTKDNKPKGTYTNDVPPLELKANNCIKNLEIEISSVETEDSSLLHQLFSKMRGDGK